MRMMKFEKYDEMKCRLFEARFTHLILQLKKLKYSLTKIPTGLS